MHKGTWGGSGELYPSKTFSFALCVRDTDVGPEEDLQGGRVQMQAPSPGQTAVGKAMGRSKGVATLPGMVVVVAVERVPQQAGAQGSRVSL